MWSSKYKISSSSALTSHEEFFLKRQVLILMMGRLLFGTLLMGTTLFYQLKKVEQISHPAENFVFWLIGSIYFLTLIYSLIFPKIKRFRTFISLQLGGDILVFSLLILATGCQDSLFLSSYLFVIIASAIFLSRRDTLLFAAHSFIYFSLIMVGNYLNLFYHLPFILLPFSINLFDLLYILIIYGTSFLVVALLSSFLVEQLRHSEEIIAQQQVQMDNLEALQRDIVMSLTSGLITTDLDGTIRFLNPRATELIGLTLSASSSPLSINSIFNNIELSDKDLIPKRCEFTYLHPNKQKKLILGLSISFLKDRQGQKTGLLYLFQDLTQLKEIEQLALRNEKLAAIGKLAAGLAHEIRNPLSSLSGSIQMLQADLQLEGEQKILMDISLKEVDRLNQLLSDFLLFARPKELSKQQENLFDILQQTLFLFKQDEHYRHINVNIDIEKNCPIQVDTKQFQQIIWNLLVNAAQAMTQYQQGNTIYITGKFDGKSTKILIADEGPGIPEELQHKIFDPFFSTKSNGTGLGLAVVQRIINEHGGTILLKQNNEQMNCFELTFPFDDNEKKTASPSDLKKAKS